MQQTIAMSLLAHGILIAGIMTLSWYEFSAEKPGTAIFVHDVVMGGSDGGTGAEGSAEDIRAVQQPQQKTKISTPSTSPSSSLAKNTSSVKNNPPAPLSEGSNRGIEGKSGSGNGAGDGSAAGLGTGSGGSGHGSAGNPILAEIRRRIESAKRYPMRAREQNIEGKVGVHFLIQSNGRVDGVRVTRSSGSRILDDAAIQAVQHSAPLPYYEKPIEFSLGFHLR